MTETKAMVLRGRAWLLAACVLGVSGCAIRGPVVRDVDGLPCMTFRKTHRQNKICAARPAPPAELENQVKRFQQEHDAGQVFVQWLQRGGLTRPLTLLVDGSPVAELVPGGLVRLRLAPGSHELSVAWDGQSAMLPLRTETGTVHFAEVDAWSKLWHIGFAWKPVDADGARQRAVLARLIADIDTQKADAGGVSVPPSP